jgi:isoleucyl-tRNA synthetase
MDRFDTHDAGRRLSAFIDDLSNWYVRRSRRRFWQGDPAALATLHEVLTSVTLLLAPITPFITERVWQDLVVPVSPGAPASVHLVAYPTVDESLVDPDLGAHMALTRRLVELGRSARASSGVKTRQPLAGAVVAGAALPEEFLSEVASELNVREISAGTAGSLVDTTAKANFRTLGKRFGNQVQEVAAAIAAADAGAFASALHDKGAATVPVKGKRLSLGPHEVIITETPRPGWAFAQDAGVSVALDLALTPDLVRAGVTREVIRQIQQARKAAGLEITDRIVLRYEATEPNTAAALTEQADAIAEEVLATDFAAGPLLGRRQEFRDEELGLTVWLRKAPRS